MTGAKKLRYASAGVLLGLVCAGLSVAVAGAGHGWNSAVPFGLASLALYPLACFGAAAPAQDARALNFALAAVAIALDAGLLARTWSEGFGYFAAVWPFATVWLLLWFGWQALVARNCLRRAG